MADSQEQIKSPLEKARTIVKETDEFFKENKYFTPPNINSLRGSKEVQAPAEVKFFYAPSQGKKIDLEKVLPTQPVVFLTEKHQCLKGTPRQKNTKINRSWKIHNVKTYHKKVLLLL